MAIVLVLTKQRYGSLGVIQISLRHVHIINIVDHVNFAWGPELTSSLLFQGLLKLRLQIVGISVVIKVYELIGE